jgi:hypothetical protein
MKAIYTVITNGYDVLNPAPIYEGWDTILFCDEDIDPKGWELRRIDKSSDPLLQSRDIKIRSHIHLKEYDLVCYIDGHQSFCHEPPSCPIWFHHSRRKDIFEEAKQIIINGRFKAKDINKQIDYYLDEGYEDCGLYLNGFFVREHTPDINLLHDVWFCETSRFTQRDQLSLPYAIWYTDIYPKGIRPERIKHSYCNVNKNHNASSSHYTR